MRSYLFRRLDKPQKIGEFTNDEHPNFKSGHLHFYSDRFSISHYQQKNNEEPKGDITTFNSRHILFSVNRYFWRNSNNVLSLVRYKWLPKTRKTKEQVCDDRLVSINAAEFIAGYDPDRAIDEMISCINNNKYPAFELYIQMVSGSKICNRKYRDNTLLWDEKEAPYMCAGIMVLDQIDMNMTDDPKIYYLPSNTVDGIELCEDKISHTIDFVIKTEAIERGGYL